MGKRIKRSTVEERKETKGERKKVSDVAACFNYCDHRCALGVLAILHFYLFSVCFLFVCFLFKNIFFNYFYFIFYIAISLF